MPAGSFTIGSPASESDRDSDEGPQHRVSIGHALAVDRFEVTFAEWDACVAAGGCGGYRPADAGWRRERRPVINVSWNDAQRYVQWLSQRTGKRYRLLSESEWEYAARAGTTTARWWGESIGTGNASCRGCGGQWDGQQTQRTAPVGSFRANGFGLYDVLGNVWEWVDDCYESSYTSASNDGGARTSCSDNNARVLRGGSWDVYPWVVRSANRSGYAADSRYYGLGFFMLWLVPTVEKFPRSQRFLLGGRIQSTALDILEALIDATYKRVRSGLLVHTNIGLEKLRLLFRLAYDLHHRDLRRYEFAARGLDEIGRMVGGWIKAHHAAQA